MTLHTFNTEHGHFRCSLLSFIIYCCSHTCACTFCILATHKDTEGTHSSVLMHVSVAAKLYTSTYRSLRLCWSWCSHTPFLHGEAGPRWTGRQRCTNVKWSFTGCLNCQEPVDKLLPVDHVGHHLCIGEQVGT